MTPPRAFPTEVFRFLEQQSQKQASQAGGQLADVGSFIESRLPVPNFMYVDPAVDNDISLNLSQASHARRAYTLLAWVSSTELLAASSQQFAIYRLESGMPPLDLLGKSD